MILIYLNIEYFLGRSKRCLSPKDFSDLLRIYPHGYPQRLWVTITAPAKRIHFESPLCHIQAKQPPEFLTFFFMPNGNTKRTFLPESHFFIKEAHLIRIAQKRRPDSLSTHFYTQFSTTLFYLKIYLEGAFLVPIIMQLIDLKMI